jgi:hypothetical protein
LRSFGGGSRWRPCSSIARANRAGADSDPLEAAEEVADLLHAEVGEAARGARDLRAYVGLDAAEATAAAFRAVALAGLEALGTFRAVALEPGAQRRAADPEVAREDLDRGAPLLG